MRRAFRRFRDRTNGSIAVNDITCSGSASSSAAAGGGRQRKVYIKKPLNAFMLFMKEMRQKVIDECTLKESAAINQILGRKVMILISKPIQSNHHNNNYRNSSSSNNNNNDDDDVRYYICINWFITFISIRLQQINVAYATLAHQMYIRQTKIDRLLWPCDINIQCEYAT